MRALGSLLAILERVFMHPLSAIGTKAENNGLLMEGMGTEDAEL